MKRHAQRTAMVLGLCACAHFAAAAPLPRSISTSRQFIVYGSDARLRGVICDLAEQTKDAALHLLAERDAWKTPIVINAQLPQANLPELPRAQLSFSQTGFGLKLQLDLRIDADVSGPAVERELLRAVYLEMIYRAAPNTPAGTAYVEPPDWLLDGTLALAANRETNAIAEALKTPLATGSVIALDDFLRQRPELLDAPSRKLYRAYAAALLLALTEGVDGRQRLARFVSDLPHSPNDTLADLHAHFPAFGADAEQMRKQWLLAVAHVAESDRYRLLSAEETERELARLLHLELRAGDRPAVSYTLEEYPDFVRMPAAVAALGGLREELLLVSGRANPLYRPVIGEYENIAAQLQRGKTKKLRERLASLRATREDLARRMSAIADYMNWYEA
ncbi:MAG: hypothetical protein M3Y86_08845, partial [Verrucomicrobiota bacterium]|nr:hypothetical protein [Verrucomicrobiota bacterium]